MSETEIITYIKYTLEHYSGDIDDLGWSTSQIKSLLSSLKKAQKERDDFKELYKVERETYNTSRICPFEKCPEIDGIKEVNSNPIRKRFDRSYRSHE